MTDINSAENTTHWLSKNNDVKLKDIDCLCLGTGRFLRSVLVPAIVAAQMKPALIQTRGRSFLQYMTKTNNNNDNKGCYEIDTVLPNGDIETTHIPIAGAYSLGRQQDKQVVMNQLLPQMKQLVIVGVGVTEAGLKSSETQAMKDLFELLQVANSCIQKQIWDKQQNQKICIINMDNVPNNGSVIHSHMMTLATNNNNNDTNMQQFLSHHVVFCNTMVDRITSQRTNSSGLVPKCEPIPNKALVILDETNSIPTTLSTLDRNKYGIVIRQSQQALQFDIDLKLRIANGTHTAIAHGMALCKLINTDVLSNPKHKLLWVDSYLHILFHDQILQGITTKDNDHDVQEAKETYNDWIGRLQHAHFGLSTFFITQNGPAKGGIRLGPTINDLVMIQKKDIKVCMAFAFACLLRWLTPMCCKNGEENSSIYVGWLSGVDKEEARNKYKNMNVKNGNVMEYADGLRYNLMDGWYEFKCVCGVESHKSEDSAMNLSDILMDIDVGKHPHVNVDVVKQYLLSNEGGKLSLDVLSKCDDFIGGIATLYGRMLSGDGGVMDILQELKDQDLLNKSCASLL